ncbi:MAG TPA: nitronate monooxygenase [Flavobacteriales bacterium]|jgi:enoyl-[acyl-carrier protein] reductase II|nr:nitronate monooxygenase [Flavobacteriales bacterium]
MNRIQSLFGIQYPVIQAGMIWCSGWELASTVSNAGGLGILGAGSMYPEVLREQIKKCQAATDRPFAVNIPLLYPSIEEHIASVIELGVPIVFTSAGNPATWTERLQSHGIKVVHVVSSVKFALKAESAGVDAVVAEGFEAGGHNGREETTTLCLVPAVADALKVPVIAAGGIGDARSTLAAFALGAEGVQLGSRFVATPESSAHQAFKDRVVDAGEGSTRLSLKALTPVRLLDNSFARQVAAAEAAGESPEALQALLGRGRAKKGMFEGDMEAGELEIGQVSGQIRQLVPAAEIVQELVREYELLTQGMADQRFHWK